MSADRPETRLATRLVFFTAGFVMACWAPLVPYAKARVGVDEARLGLILLCIGVGSIAAMPVTGALSSRFGCRPMILAGALGVSLLLPLLALAPSAGMLSAALFAFGATLGTLDVAMNVHAVEVEHAAPAPLMSGFHALFSVGGFAGATAVTLLLSVGVSPLAATLAASALSLTMTAVAGPRLLTTRPPAGGPSLVMPHGIVLLLALLIAVAFLVEGAMLDWGALLLTEMHLTSAQRSGLGYVIFSAAMTVGRFLGDRVIARLGARQVLVQGTLLALIGYSMLLLAPLAPVALSGFLLIGLGIANIVPSLFSAAGRQRDMPAPLAIAALTMVGYVGLLAGPATVGFVANHVGLPTAFWLLAGLLCLVPLASCKV